MGGPGLRPQICAPLQAHLERLRQFKHHVYTMFTAYHSGEAATIYTPSWGA